MEVEASRGMGCCSPTLGWKRIERERERKRERETERERERRGMGGGLCVNI